MCSGYHFNITWHWSFITEIYDELHLMKWKIKLNLIAIYANINDWQKYFIQILTIIIEIQYDWQKCVIHVLKVVIKIQCSTMCLRLILQETRLYEVCKMLSNLFSHKVT